MGIPRRGGQRRPHPPPAVRRPEEDVTVELAAREQAAVRGEGDRADLVGAQRGERLVAADVENLDAVGVAGSTGRGAPNAIASCEPSGLKASPLTCGGRCSGRPISLRPSRSQIRTAPSPSRGPHAGRGEQASRPKASASDVVGVASRGRGGREERADALPRPGVPEADAAASAGHRQPAPVGRVLDRERRLSAKASKPPVGAASRRLSGPPGHRASPTQAYPRRGSGRRRVGRSCRLC